jgi:membrane-associated phospholipid phosphatase
VRILALLLAISLLSPLEGLDRAVQGAVQSRRSPFWEAPMRGATAVGRPAVLFGGLLAIAVFCGPAGPATARACLFALAPANLVVEGLKWSLNRARPDGEHKRSNASFPSSHAANAFALAAVLARRWRRTGPALWLAATAIAWSRVYLNRHFLSDIVVGAAIGLLCGWAVERWLAHRAERRTRA